jgi:hypothetical protein
MLGSVVSGRVWFDPRCAHRAFALSAAKGLASAKTCETAAQTLRRHWIAWSPDPIRTPHIGASKFATERESSL